MPDPFYIVNTPSGTSVTVLFDRLLFFAVKSMSGKYIHEFYYEGVEKPAQAYAAKDYTSEITQAYTAWYNTHRRPRAFPF